MFLYILIIYVRYLAALLESRLRESVVLKKSEDQIDRLSYRALLLAHRPYTEPCEPDNRGVLLAECVAESYTVKGCFELPQRMCTLDNGFQTFPATRHCMPKAIHSDLKHDISLVSILRAVRAGLQIL